MSRTMWQVHKYHKEIIPKDNYVPKGNKKRPVKKNINRIRVTATNIGKRITIIIENIIFLPQALDQQHEFRSKVLSASIISLLYKTCIYLFFGKLFFLYRTIFPFVFSEQLLKSKKTTKSSKNPETYIKMTCVWIITWK